MKAAPTAAWVWAFTVYSWGMTTVSAAWFARRFAAGRGETLGVAASLAWQGAIYAAWLPAAAVVWLVLRRFGAGLKGVAASFAAGLAVVPLEAIASSLIDRAMLRGGDLWGAVLGRAPVCILLYSAIVAVGLAAVHHRRAAEARGRNALLEAALAQARTVAAPPRPERLMVMSGSRRIPVDIAAVEWFGAADNYVVVHWAGREGLLRATLQSLEARLDPRQFARAHRSSLVNLAHVREAQPLSDGSWRLTLASGAEVVTSRTYREALLERLEGRP
ncbi:LytTR family transcriptional regulator DNA-binding domain-containing protein [Caulobacter hibisci]|uniref:LytTR family transcriptional regulator DNA-binding domain-containing protein n=1 Tax=Caulobacter hibisci TaxID=2035993 RepID=A0ABS0T7K0_9CAUL|nr:LytTR family transcriptional regulator DNA-binding domain-containing protein [Caulobacter hibisci]